MKDAGGVDYVKWGFNSPRLLIKAFQIGMLAQNER
jgi:hypothetical protein